MSLVLGTNLTPEQMTEKIAATAAHKHHNLAAYLVDGRTRVSPAQYDGIMRYLARCRDLAGNESTRETMVRHIPVHAERQAQAASRETIADIPAGFYATPSRTGNNDLDFWKVTEGRKPGIRFVKRVLGGGTEKYPKLVEVSRTEGFAALKAIVKTGIGKAAEEYADNEKRCMKCGIHLTDDASRAARMGPVCRGDR